MNTDDHDRFGRMERIGESGVPEATYNDLIDLSQEGIDVAIYKDSVRCCYWVTWGENYTGRPFLTLEHVCAFIEGLCIGMTGTCYHEWPSIVLPIAQQRQEQAGQQIVFLAGYGTSERMDVRGVYSDEEMAKQVPGVNIIQPVEVNRAYNPLYLVRNEGGNDRRR